MTLPEIVLWQHLRRGAIAGLRFRRQHPIGPYVLDFYCSAPKLALEVDGAAHDTLTAAQHDAERDTWPAQHGVSVMRFRANDILRDDILDGVLAVIGEAAKMASAPRGEEEPA